MLVRQLEEELRMRMRQPNIEMQQQMEAIFAENEHLTREIAILRDTIKVSPPIKRKRIHKKTNGFITIPSTILLIIQQSGARDSLGNPKTDTQRPRREYQKIAGNVAKQRNG